MKYFILSIYDSSICRELYNLYWNIFKDNAYSIFKDYLLNMYNDYDLIIICEDGDIDIVKGGVV